MVESPIMVVHYRHIFHCRVLIKLYIFDLLYKLYLGINRESKGENGYRIVIECLREGETKLSNSWKGETKTPWITIVL
jgi:hypothetical protein